MTGAQRAAPVRVPRIRYRISWWRRLGAVIGLLVVVVFLAALLAGIVGAVIAAITLVLNNAVSG